MHIYEGHVILSFPEIGLYSYQKCNTRQCTFHSGPCLIHHLHLTGARTFEAKAPIGNYSNHLHDEFPNYRGVYMYAMKKQYVVISIGWAPTLYGITTEWHWTQFPGSMVLLSLQALVVGKNVGKPIRICKDPHS